MLSTHSHIDHNITCLCVCNSKTVVFKFLVLVAHFEYLFFSCGALELEYRNKFVIKSHLLSNFSLSRFQVANLSVLETLLAKIPFLFQWKFFQQGALIVNRPRYLPFVEDSMNKRSLYKFNCARSEVAYFDNNCCNTTTKNNRYLHCCSSSLLPSYKYTLIVVV